MESQWICSAKSRYWGWGRKGEGRRRGRGRGGGGGEGKEDWEGRREEGEGLGEQNPIKIYPRNIIHSGTCMSHKGVNSIKTDSWTTWVLTAQVHLSAFLFNKHVNVFSL